MTKIMLFFWTTLLLILAGCEKAPVEETPFPEVNEANCTAADAAALDAAKRGELTERMREFASLCATRDGYRPSPEKRY